MGKWDSLIERLGRASPTSWDVMEEVARSKGPMAGYSREIISLPRAEGTMKDVDDFLRQHGGTIGNPIGRGRESLVFAVRGGEGTPERVVKFQSPGAGRGFTLPTGLDGVAGYSATNRFPSGLRVAIQDRASRVLDHNARARFGGIAEEAKWMGMADRVQRSLAARGLEWTDPHAANVGIMPSGRLAAIDGAVIKMDAGEPLRVQMSEEDAIRLLLERAP